MPKETSRTATIRNAVQRRILLLDGAMGTMIQSLGPGEAIFRGSRFARHDKALAGCCDVLCLTAPELISGIHSEYLDAGADIIRANSFNATPFSLTRYGLADYAAEIAEAAARIARDAADRREASHPGERHWVAGCMGPTAHSLTMAASVGESAVTPAALEMAYMHQAEALLRGGADVLLVETVFDILNAKAALHGARRAIDASGRDVPLMLSATLTGSGRLLSGHTPEALIASTESAGLWSIGFNCGFGPKGLLPHLAALGSARMLTSCHPNAGLPDESGHYPESPMAMAEQLRPALEGGALNIVGGCCGTTPAHIRAIAGVARGCTARRVP